MTTQKDGPGPPQFFADAELATLYETLSPFLQGLLTRAFEVPPRDAEWLVRETFIDYGQSKPVPDVRAWIVVATCKRASLYRQSRGFPAASEAEAEQRTATALSYHEAMERLPSRAREALHLRYEEKKTYAEVARELGISAYAAERFVERSLKRLRGLLRPPSPRSSGGS